MGFSLRKAVNSVGDGIEHGVDKVKKKAGEIIDDGAHIVGDGLEHVGLDDAADWVEDHGDAVADHLGAHVAEQQLGQTDDPKELLHGDSGKIQEVALHLATLSKAFETGHTGLAHLDPGDWDGLGAEAFRARFKTQPPKWAHAATACHDAASALLTYADTVDWALGQAREAVRLWKQGQAKRKAAADAYNSAVDQYHDDVKAYNDKVDNGKDPGTEPVKPADFTDPGAKDKQAAKHTLDAARRQRDSAAATAEAKVREATKLAPPKPDFTDRMQNDLGDVGKALPIAGEHFAGGLVRSLTDLNKFARGLNPTDPYNLTHPAQYLTHLNATAAGLADMTQHPERLPGIILGTGWGSDGSEASGRLIGNILLAIATDGGSAAGKTAAEDAAKGAAEQAAKNGARAAAEDPLKAGIRKGAKDCVGDPIDVATGDVILTQTDVTLPGTLPLVLERTHLSSYRTGRLFGPSWASTLDQRLELDERGAVFVTDDGALLLYPVPEPHVPVLPVAGPRWPLEWDGAPGGLLRITNTDTGHTLRFSAGPGAPTPARGPMLLPLTDVSDRNGNNYAITYDDAGIPREIRHSGGYHVAIDTARGRVTGLRLLGHDRSDVRVRTFGYGSGGHLSKVVNSDGLPYRFTYDQAGRITSWSDRNDTAYHYAYDSRGRCVATHGADGHLNSTLGYDDATRTTTFTDSLGHQHTYTHNTAYRLIAETDPLGHTTTRQWDAENRLTAIIDPLGRATHFGYDGPSHTQPSVITQPDGTSATATYNSWGQPLAVTGPGGGVWRHTYDERGNLASLTDPSGAVTSYTYDSAGAPLSVTDPLGATEHIATDEAGLAVSVTDALGQRTAVERDAFGRVVATTDPLSVRTEQRWTAEGLLASRTTAGQETESWEWDAEGNLLAQTGSSGATTSYVYGPFGLPVSRVDPDGTRYDFGYDTELRLTTVTNPQGLQWRYEFDPAGRLTAETDFNGRLLTYEHDAAGQLTGRVNGARQRLEFVRDLLGRVVEQRAADRTVSTFTYSPSGHIVRAANEHTAVRIERDPLGRVLREETGDRAISNTYDATGRRVERRTPSGAVSVWTYDIAGRAVALDSGAGTLGFEYDAAGQETVRRLGAAVAIRQGWDAIGRLTDLEVSARPSSDGSAVLRRRYAYSGSGAVREIADLHTGSRRFTLDATDRVTAVNAADWQESYAYDAVGNVVRSAFTGDKDDENAHSARGTLVHAARRHQYAYDGQGRLIRHDHRLLNGRRRTWTYTWDAEDRLVGVSTPDGSLWRYRYDPLGRRIAKERMGDAGQVLERTEFTWDGTRLAEESSGPRHRTWEYAQESHRPLAQLTTQDEYDLRFYAIVTDIAGAPTELLDESGVVVWRLRTTLWGAGSGSGPEDCPLRFQGQYRDGETALHYNLHRFYDPTTASYVSPDPLGLDAAPNHHAYAPNPLLWADPLGLSCDPAGPGNAANYAKQLRYLQQAQKYGKGGIRELQDGRIRFYGLVAEAKTPGEMLGRRVVREWDPATDSTRIWQETVDHSGRVRIVRPDVKVTGGKKVHYLFDAQGNFIGTF
ncbi:DUF6531 domain-containing protein [Streptomyces cocklensis]|uniref:RHS repeat-associated core domain-containing protein n=1 Tax=Actinacidiphila cocklensis TaxID=887465 RepID=A0A9W4GU82_9ACTN|nr:DUF6531 domain-containing protein [Actinacidiphila cocklensis]MDD1056691.1 DUF6531 domain-containing protein [Actinacidiphila cocklensis]CAG6397843.1 RHS repeat-associated core domain-containing protein [Actinacidiphila cocklensis]